MVSDGAKFAVGNIERLFKEARQNTRVKKENGRRVVSLVNDRVSKRKRRLIGNQGSTCEHNVQKRKRSRGSKESLGGHHIQSKRTRQEVRGCKRNPSSWSKGPQRERNRGQEREINKRKLPSSANSNWPLKKKRRESKESLQQRETGLFPFVEVTFADRTLSLPPASQK
ncbi:hypothetical protein TNCV_4149281 [Trichonephila clavipes]|nr:hypothetical protein TNCV_4149281 [Trichonephila clavipes]